MIVGVIGNGSSVAKRTLASLLANGDSINPIIKLDYDPVSDILPIDEVIEVVDTDNVVKGPVSVIEAFSAEGFEVAEYDGSLDKSKYSLVTRVGCKDRIEDVAHILSRFITYENITWIKDNNGWFTTATLTEGTNLYINHRQNGIKRIYCVKDRYMQTGWQDIVSDEINCRLYFDEHSGELLTGWNKIDGAWYYFSNDIPFIISKEVTIDGITYTTNANGVLAGYTGDKAPE